MIISHKYRFLFIEVPKTGSSSIRISLKDALNLTDISELNNIKDLDKIDFMCGLKFGYHNHVKLQLALNKHPYVKNYFKFAFVRNPWDLQVSMYHYYKNGGIYKRLIGKQNALHPVSDHERKTHEKALKFSVGKWSREVHKPIIQFNYLSINDQLKMDYIGRFENLQQDFNKICKKIGIKKIELPMANKSKRKNYREYYNKYFKQYIAEICKKDIESFGYTY